MDIRFSASEQQFGAQKYGWHPINVVRNLASRIVDNSIVGLTLYSDWR